MTEQLTAPLDELTEREYEVLDLLAEGLSNREIAEQLFLSKETVRWYNKRIYSKLGANRRTEAIAVARRMGLIGNEDADSRSATHTESTRHQLPDTLGPFIGRDAEITELTDLLANPEVRLLSIIAAGGMGKSRLSLELGHRIQAEYDHGAAFIDLAPVQKADDIPRQIITSLGLAASNQASPRDLFLNYCREKNLLLIFDNVEQVLAGATLLAEILETAPGVRLIVTSRERLNLRIETTFYLQPVTEKAGMLFREVAAMMHPGVVIDADEDPHIDQVVELVGGMPLALTLAATWVDTLTIPEIAEEIRRNLDFLSAELGDMPERQRSIHAVIDPTWERLSEHEQRAFTWSSVFCGGFTRSLFQTVTDSSVRDLQSLLGRSLILPSYERRYNMHPLLRQYAEEKLQANGEFTAARIAHMQTLIDYVETHTKNLYSGAYMEALRELDVEHDNYRWGLDWALAGDAVSAGVDLTLALCQFWETHALAYEAESYLSRALAHPLTDEQRAPLLCWRSRFNSRLGRKDAAQQDVDEALALAESLDNKPIIARSLIYRTHMLPVSERKPLIDRALQISEAIEDTQLIITCHNELGIIYATERTFDEALVHYERALSISEAAGNLRGIGQLLYNIGLVHQQLHDLPRAREHFERSIELMRQIGNRAAVARRLAVLAFDAIQNEDFELAEHHLLESEAICTEIGESQRWTFTLMGLGVLHYIKTDFQRAQADLERGLQMAQTLNDLPREAEFHQLLVAVNLNQNQHAIAALHVKRTLDIAAAVQRPYTTWLSLLTYVQFDWQTQHSTLAVGLAAVVDRLRDHGTNIDLRYTLDPFIYRIKQHIGADAWETAQEEAAAITLDQALAEALTGIENMASSE